MHIQSFEQFSRGSFRIIFLGGISCNEELLPSITNGDPFQYIKRWLSTADLVVGNLKTTLAGKTSEYPLLSANDALADYMQGKVDIAFTANNHSVDFGEEGLKRTAEALQKRSIMPIGTSAGKRTKIIDQRLHNHNIAFLNYTEFINGNEKEQATIYQGSDSPEASAGLINFYEQAEVKKDLNLASKRAEFIVTGLHQSNQTGGAEMFGYQTTSKQRQKLRGIIQEGADVVIGSFPQHFQGAYQDKEGRIAVYSLGNCLTAMKPRKEYPYNSGCIMVMNCDGFSNVTYSFLPTACVKEEKSGNYYVLPLFLLEGGGFSFLSSEENANLTQELFNIRKVLREHLLVEERIPIQLI